MKNKIMIIGDTSGKLSSIFEKNMGDKYEIVDMSLESLNTIIRKTNSILNERPDNSLSFVHYRPNNEDSWRTEFDRLSSSNSSNTEIDLIQRFPHCKHIYFGLSGRIISRYKGISIYENVTGHANTTHLVSSDIGMNYNVNSNHTELVNPFPLKKGTEVLAWTTHFQSVSYSSLKSPKELNIEFLECEIVKFGDNMLYIEYDLILQDQETVKITSNIITEFFK